ncbi:hemolysin [Adhaeribacter arboris]|uniref:Hemolysin n=1 Tax=Adhaeribacter arboris TaxID=2072846 RepID=A0A2T2YGR1_9BACT|nr:GNAT family N-acyltransferase [Adhaeribacter arboris]PSR54658.1 hemolysin [Adhaeribacter arboris]
MDIISASDFAQAAKLNKTNTRFLTPLLMRVLKLHQLNAVYATTQNLNGLEFIDGVLAQLGIQFEVDAKELQNIPAHGAFIAIANHPYGGIDGLILLKILASVRPDFKILANKVLQKITNIEDYFIPVNPFKTHDQDNVPGLRKAIDLIHNDSALGIFPGGEVSSVQADEDYKISDPVWQPAVGRLISMAKVPVLPVYFSGSNSLSFNLLGLLHPLLRTVRLPAELFNKQGVCIKIRIGKPVPYDTLHGLPNADVLAYLRAKTYALGSSFFRPSVPAIFKYAIVPKPVLLETDRAAILNDIKNLKSASCLLRHHQYAVYMARQEEMPCVMREIGRLRELTFRQVGEGTNHETDLDQYDAHYHHLFLFDHQAQLIVGAYRLGKGKELYRKHGKKGFYLHSLFKMQPEFIPILKQSIELGRSFIRPEYQKKTLPLLLLWKGISTYLNGKLSYQYILGPVSISNHFSRVSKALMVDFITHHFYDADLAQFIKPRKKFRYRFSKYYPETLLQKNIQTLHCLDDLIAEIEPKHMGLPILLKRYLKQNARIIGFNIDPKFSNALDGLMIMRVSELPAATACMLDRIPLPQNSPSEE